MRLAQVEQFAGRRMVAPRTNGVEIGFQLGIVKSGGNAFARELRVPVRVEHVDHHHADADGVDAGPWLRLVVQQVELRRQRILMLRDVEIYAARIGFVAGALFRRQVCVDAMRGIAKLEHALRLVVAQQ